MYYLTFDVFIMVSFVLYCVLWKAAKKPTDFINIVDTYGTKNLMYICMYVCICYVCRYACIQVSTYILVYIYIYVHLSVHV